MTRFVKIVRFFQIFTVALLLHPKPTHAQRRNSPTNSPSLQDNEVDTRSSCPAKKVYLRAPQATLLSPDAQAQCRPTLSCGLWCRDEDLCVRENLPRCTTYRKRECKTTFVNKCGRDIPRRRRRSLKRLIQAKKRLLRKVFGGGSKRRRQSRNRYNRRKGQANPQGSSGFSFHHNHKASYQAPGFHHHSISSSSFHGYQPQQNGGTLPNIQSTHIHTFSPQSPAAPTILNTHNGGNNVWTSSSSSSFSIGAPPPALGGSAPWTTSTR